jgi:hypothetical protein
MREALYLIFAVIVIGAFILGMKYKEADIVRSCNSYGSFTTVDARYSCILSHKIQ